MILTPMIRLAAALAVVSLAACAAGEERSLAPDLAYPRYDVSVDGAILDRGPAPDIVFPDGSTPPTPDSAPPSPDGPTCQIGTPDNCKSCGHICPGSDSPSTARVCLSGGLCNIECKGEHYDVNGDHLDGCEREDDLPIHDVESAAKSLGNVSDCNNKKSTTARIPSDQRRHQKAPVERELGRADWFSMHISDNTGCIVDAKATVKLTNLPSGASYRLSAYYKCDNGKSFGPVVQTASGGSSTTLTPDTGCTLIGDDSGTIQIVVEKLSGPHSPAGYTIEIEP